MLWTEHRDRYAAGELVIRRIPYFTFRELTSGITPEDMASIGRLNAKRTAGGTLTQEETDRLTEIASRWPVDELRGACLVPPVSGEEVRRILAELPRAESEKAERILDMCVTPDVSKDDVNDPLAVLMIARGLFSIDPAEMTVSQGYAITAMLTPREG